MSKEANKTTMSERILGSAENLFRKLTFSGVHMGKLSSYVGVSRKTLYNHFPGGKREIWESCIRRRLDEFTVRMMSIVTDSEKNFIERANELLQTGRDAMALFYGPRGLIRTVEDEKIFFPELKQRYVDGLAVFLEEGRSLGILRPNLPLRTLASTLMVLIYEWEQVDDLSKNGECRDLPEFVERVMFDGILVDEWSAILADGRTS